MPPAAAIAAGGLTLAANASEGRKAGDKQPECARLLLMRCVPNLVDVGAFLIKGFVGPPVTIVRSGRVIILTIDDPFAGRGYAICKTIQVAHHCVSRPLS